MFEPLNNMEIRGGKPNNAFGMVRNNGTKPHQGWDLWAPIGTPIYAVADGLIEYVQTDSIYGLQLCMSFTDNSGISDTGLLYAFYAHLSQAYFNKGFEVTEGMIIGLTGDSGNARGFSFDEQHLHFEIRTLPYLGKGLRGRLDPAEFLGYHLLTCSEEILCSVE